MLIEVNERNNVEITPEMIEAGIEAFKLNSIDGEVGRSQLSHQSLVEDVFRAMLEVSPLVPQVQALALSGPAK